MSHETNYGSYADIDMYDRPGVSDMLGDDVKKVEVEVHDMVHDLASVFLNTETWNDGDWEEWRDIVRDCL